MPLRLVLGGACIPGISRHLLAALLLCPQLCVVLGEALAQTLGLGHLLLDAAGDAARLARRQGLGGEVIDARHETVVY